MKIEAKNLGIQNEKGILEEFSWYISTLWLEEVVMDELLRVSVKIGIKI